MKCEFPRKCRNFDKTNKKRPPSESFFYPKNNGCKNIHQMSAFDGNKPMNVKAMHGKLRQQFL